MQRRRGRPPSFTRDELIAAARRLGADALSLSTLATSLGVARTGLYWYVHDVNEIGEAVLAGILDQNEAWGWEPEPDCSWDELMASYARMVRRGLIAAGAWIRYTTPRLVFAPAQLRAMDGLVGRLCACGFPAEEAARAFAYLFQVVLASVGSGEAPVRQMHRALLAEFESDLDTGQLTILREVVAITAKTSPDAQFEYALDCTLRGIAERSGIGLGAVQDGGGRRRRRRTSS